MISDNEYLERIVAGIHSATSEKAMVLWNEIINGRQFDVVIRFNFGTLSYLTVVEVKNKTRKISASDLEAFVTKSRDQRTNKSVFVSTAGFQSGAIEVAKRHGVDIFTVGFDARELNLSTRTTFVALHRPGQPLAKPQLSISEPCPVVIVEKLTLNYVDGRRVDLPSEPSQMFYYVSKSLLSSGCHLEALIRSHITHMLKNGEILDEVIRINPAQRIDPPDQYFFPSGRIRGIRFLAVGRPGRVLSGTMRIEPGLLRPPIIYTNALTGEVKRFPMDQLPLGFDDVTTGCFYFTPNPSRYYYCNDVDKGVINWSLIESFQNGSLITATFRQKTEYAGNYIEVRNKNIIERLQRRLADHRLSG